MKFQPKTDWKYDDIPTEGDFNRIEQGIADALEGNDPIIQQDTPPDGVKEGRLWLDTSDDTYQGTVFESLKGEIAGHLVEKSTLLKAGHVQLSNTISENETTAVTPKALKAVNDEVAKRFLSTGGKITGIVTLENNAPILEFSETDTGKKFYIVVDGSGFNIREDSLSSTSHPLVIKNGVLSTYDKTILHTGNMETLIPGVMKKISEMDLAALTPSQSFTINGLAEYKKIVIKFTKVNFDGQYSSILDFWYNNYRKPNMYRVYIGGTSTGSSGETHSMAYGNSYNNFDLEIVIDGESRNYESQWSYKLRDYTNRLVLVSSRLHGHVSPDSSNIGAFSDTVDTVTFQTRVVNIPGVTVKFLSGIVEVWGERK